MRSNRYCGFIYGGDTRAKEAGDAQAGGCDSCRANRSGDAGRCDERRGGAENGSTFEVTCPGSATFTIVTPPGNGAFTPAFGPNQVFIPYDVQGTVTADGVVVDEFHDVKRAPVPAGAVSCAFETSFEDGGSLSVITGTALVVPRP